MPLATRMRRLFSLCLLVLAEGAKAPAPRRERKLLAAEALEQASHSHQRALITEENIYGHNSTACRPDIVGGGNASFCDGARVRDVRHRGIPTKPWTSRHLTPFQNKRTNGRSTFSPA